MLHGVLSGSGVCVGLFKEDAHSLRNLIVCSKHDAIALSSCQDILLFVLNYLHDIMYL